MSIQQTIEQLAAEFDGRIGVSVLDLQSDETYGCLAAAVFPTASVIKLGVLVTLMAQYETGIANLDDPIMLRRRRFDDRQRRFAIFDARPGHAGARLCLSDDEYQRQSGHECPHRLRWFGEYPGLFDRLWLSRRQAASQAGVRHAARRGGTVGHSHPGWIDSFVDGRFPAANRLPGGVRRDDAHDEWGGFRPGRPLSSLFALWQLWRR